MTKIPTCAGAFACITLFISLVLLIVSFSTPGWSTCYVKGWYDGGSDDWPINTYVGLVYATHSQPFNTSSHSIQNIPNCDENSDFDFVDCSFKERRSATFALLFIAMICNIFAFVAIIVSMVKSKKKLRYASIGASWFSLILIMISLIVLGTTKDSKALFYNGSCTSKFKYGYSLYLCIVSLILVIISSLLRFFCKLTKHVKLPENDVQMKQTTSTVVVQQPVIMQPGMMQPTMMQQPVMMQPGMVQQPIMMQPDMMQQPVMMQPGMMQQPVMMQQPPTVEQQSATEQPATIEQPEYTKAEN